MSEIDRQTLLLLDASTLKIQIGLLRHRQWQAFYYSEREALDALFIGVDACLKKAKLSLDAIDGFLFCEGPGSLLGIRLAAMAIEGWCSLPAHQHASLYSYRSLEVAAAFLKLQQVVPPFHLISGFKKSCWNILSVKKNESETTLDQISSEELNQLHGPLFHLRQRKDWQRPPSQTQPCPYALAQLPEVLDTPGLLRRSEHPRAYLHKAAEYTQWKVQRHRVSMKF